PGDPGLTLDHGFGPALQRQRYSSSASASSFACCAALTFVDPAAGEAAAGRDTTRMVRPCRCLTSSWLMNGQAPWFSGSSCTHTTPACGYRESAAVTSSFGIG